MTSPGSSPLIYLDLDFMVVDLHARLVAGYNAEFGTSVALEAAHETRHTDGQLITEIYSKYLAADNVFRDLQPLAGALDAVAELKTLGHVLVVSAPSRNPDSARDKIVWVERFLKIKKSDVILMKHKFLLTGDIWLDDWPENIVAIRARNPKAFIGAIAYPHNNDVADQLTVRAEGHLDTASSWKEIIGALRGYLRLRG